MKKSLLASQLRRERPEALGVAVGQLLRLDAERVRRIRDGLAVLVGAGQEEHVLPALAVVAGHHVGRDRRVRVAEVRRRVDVVDRGGHVEGHAAPRLLARAERAVLTLTLARGVARDLPVELVGADAGQLGHRRGRRTRLGAGVDQLAQRRERVGAQATSRPRAAAPHTSTISPRGGLAR